MKGFEKDVGSKTTLRITYPEGAMQRPEQYERDSLFVLAGFKWQDFKWLKYIVYKERVVSSLRPGSSPSSSGPAQLPRQPLPLTWAKNSRNLSREAVRTRCSQGAEGPGDARVAAQTPGADVPAVCCLPAETQALVLPWPSLSQTPGAASAALVGPPLAFTESSHLASPGLTADLHNSLS